MLSSTSSPYTTTTPPRRTHRKRVSAARLSSDTTHSLPTYQSQQIRLPQDLLASPTPSDQPPDYPGSVDSDSAQEADEDTDTEFTAASSPSRVRFPGTKRRTSKSLTSSSDAYLDQLLERSVHALEISNSLLQQSSMSSHELSRGASGSSSGQIPSLLSRRGSTGSAQDSVASRSRTRRSRFVNRALPDPIADAGEDSDSSHRLPLWRTHEDRRDKWTQDMDELSRDVEGLFGNGTGMTASASLPASSPIASTSRQSVGARRRPSLDLHVATLPSHLRLDQPDRSSLIAPPPRALTLYVASNDADERNKITLPSTLGLRGTSAVHELHQPSRAAEMLAALSSPNPALSSQQPTRLPFLARSRTIAGGERSSASPSSRGRGGLRPSASPHSQASSRPPSVTRSDSQIVPGPASRSRSQTPKPLALWHPTPVHKVHRRMTPPPEESSSSEDFTPQQTMSALRKILDDHPDPAALLVAKKPAFMPRTPPPAPQSSTSTATASISHLFTKGTHRASSPTPRQSAMKGGSVPSTPTTAEGSWLRNGSATGSGVSTPKRISFARLPEPHSAKNSAFKLNRERARRSKPRSRSSTSARVMKANEEAEAEAESWWIRWLVGPSATGNTRGMDKMEDRMGRGGSRIGFASGGIDEWAI